eukprot:14871705-Ditylum_brightwellii.AAC.1
MFKYIHGGLELVEPNVIQEAWLSKQARDEADGLWTFSKVLNHCIEEKGKIEVAILWYDGETSWEPLSVMRKDDPVKLAGYAKEHKLLEQQGWKQAKSIAKCKKKFTRLLKLMKATKKKYQKQSFSQKSINLEWKYPELETSKVQ